MKFIINPSPSRRRLAAAAIFLGTATFVSLAAAVRPAVADSTVLVADTGHNEVRQYTVDALDGAWSLTKIFSSPGDGSNLLKPTGVAYDGANSVYVGEGDIATGTRILEYDLSGTFVGVVATLAGQVVDGLTMAPDGNLLFSNPFGDALFSTTDNIWKVNVNTGAVQEFITPGDPLFSSPYQLVNPRGLAVNGNTLYVANRDAMGSQTGSILRFDANTGAYLDAGIGANPGAINDDVYGDFDVAQGLHFDAASNRLYASVFSGGQDIFEIDVTTALPPFGPAVGPGVTKVYNPSDTGGILDLAVVDGDLYWTSFNNNAVYRLDAVDTKTQVVSGLSGPGRMAEIPFQAGDALPSTWLVDGFGNWATSGNWSAAGAPNSNKASAIFGSAIAVNHTVYADGDFKVKMIAFENANSYAVAGNGTVTLEANTGDALIEVVQGAHQFQTEVSLGSDLDIDIAPGASLAFNNVLRLNGNTLTNIGPVTAAINNQLILDGGTVALTAGSTLALSGENHQLDGGLRLLADDSLLVNGAKFDLLDFDALADEFDSLELPALSAGLSWNTSQLYLDGVVAVVPEPTGVIMLIVGLVAASHKRRRS